jgi:hypothetical protein
MTQPTEHGRGLAPELIREQKEHNRLTRWFLDIIQRDAERRHKRAIEHFAECTATSAWEATGAFRHFGTQPPNTLKYMLEWLHCNGVGSESDDIQAAVIQACRRKAGL